MTDGGKLPEGSPDILYAVAQSYTVFSFLTVGLV